MVDYVDTIAISTPQPVPIRTREELERINPGAVHYREGEWKHRQYMGEEYRFRLRSYLRIHQPSLATYDLVVKHLPNHKMSRLDLALDLLAKSQADADILNDQLLTRHVVQLWRRANWSTLDYQDTIYYRHHEPDDRTTQRGRDIAVYSSKPCKLTGQPAAHLDFRFFGREACRRCGVLTAGDLVNFDRRARIRESFRLADIRWNRAAELFDAEVRKYARRSRRRPLPAFEAPARRLETLIARQLMGPDEDQPTWDEFMDYPVQKVLDAARFLRTSAIILPADRIVRNRPLSI